MIKVTSAQLRNTQRKGWSDLHQESASPYKKIEDMALISSAAQSDVISGYAHEGGTNGQGLSQELASSILQEIFLEFGFID